MSCLSFEQLVDYWAGEAPPQLDTDAAETHLFECEACERRLSAVARLCASVSQVPRHHGGSDLCLTSALVRRLEADGLKIRHYRAAPGEHVPCGIDRDDDLVVSWFSVDRPPGERLDLIVELLGTTRRHEDVPIDAETGRIIHAIPGDVLRRLPTTLVTIRVLAGERVCTEYYFHHTASAS